MSAFRAELREYKYGRHQSEDPAHPAKTDWNIVMQSMRSSRRAAASIAGHRMKGSTGWIALALLVTGSDGAPTSSGGAGSSAARVDYGTKRFTVEDRAEALVALDGALERLASLSPRLSQVVECRFFGGMTEEETATALGVTDRTVRRDWIKAKGWLLTDIAEVDES